METTDRVDYEQRCKNVQNLLNVDGWVRTGCGVWIIEVYVGGVLEELN